MLESRDPEIHYEAVCAAGDQEVEAAWPHIADILASPASDKRLLLVAIEAAATIRPDEAGQALLDLSDSPDEDIAEAAREAIKMAETYSQGQRR